MPHGRKRRGGKRGGGTLQVVQRPPPPTTSQLNATIEELKAAISELSQELAEELARGTGLEVGRAMASGQLDALGLLDDNNGPPPAFQIHEATNNPVAGSSSASGGAAAEDNKIFDVFGQDVSKGLSLPPCCKIVECCNCHEKVASARFSTHLEKCMNGKGRTSSRDNKNKKE